MQFIEIDCPRCEVPNTVRVDVGRLHRCAHCGGPLRVRQSTLDPSHLDRSIEGHDVDELDRFFESVAEDSMARAEQLLCKLSASMPTSLRKRPGAMARWMANWVLQQLDTESLPPGVDARSYRREELAVYVAAASAAIELMVDPHQHAMATRRALYKATRRHRGFAGPADVERAALAYADSYGADDLAAVGLIGGRQVSHDIVGEGLVVAGSSLTFVAAWSKVAWAHMAPTFTIA